VPVAGDRIIRLIEAGRARDAGALRQDARHFDRLSAGEAERLRGHILAAFEKGGVPEQALPAIREELRTSFSPVVLAGAARAVRSLDAVDEEMRALLADASERIALRDEYVAFGDAPALTARQEIAGTLARLAPRPCCGTTGAAGAAPPFALDASALERVVLEDQSEARMALLPLLRERTGLIAFFYTRCMNPAKCSLTVTRLGDFGRSGAGSRTNLLAITYDGRFDTSARLRAYGLARGFEYGNQARLVRCASGWPAVRRAFRLKVGYGEATVNEHARELFVVDRDLRARGLEPDILADPDRLERILASID
jgi:hypothetical protein